MRGWASNKMLSHDVTCAEESDKVLRVEGVVTKGETRNRQLQGWQPAGDKKEWIVLDVHAVQKHLHMDDKLVVKSEGVTDKEGVVLVAADVKEMGGGSVEASVVVGTQRNGRPESLPLLRKKAEEHMSFYTTPNVHLLYASTWCSIHRTITNHIINHIIIHTINHTINHIASSHHKHSPHSHRLHHSVLFCSCPTGTRWRRVSAE